MYRSLGIRLELCSEDKNPNETLDTGPRYVTSFYSGTNQEKKGSSNEVEAHGHKTFLH